MGRSRVSVEQRAGVVEGCAQIREADAGVREKARAARVSRPTVTRIEGGRRRPRRDQAARVARRMVAMLRS
jgi:hypothetical protein